MVSALTVYLGDLRALWKSKALGAQGHGMLGLLTSSNVSSQIRASAATHPSSSQVDVARSSGAAVNRLSVPADSKHWSKVVLWPLVEVRQRAASSTGMFGHFFLDGYGLGVYPASLTTLSVGILTARIPLRCGAPHLTPAEWKTAFAAQINRVQLGWACAELATEP